MNKIISALSVLIVGLGVWWGYTRFFADGTDLLTIPDGSTTITDSNVASTLPEASPDATAVVVTPIEPISEVPTVEIATLTPFVTEAGGPAPTATIPGTGEPTDESDAILTETPTPELTEEPTPTLEPSPTDAPGGAWVPHTVVGVETNDTLNVRNGPGVDFEVVGTLNPHASNVFVTDGGRDVGESVWVPVSSGNVQGWVNSAFLARSVGTADSAAVAAATQTLLALRNFDLATFGALAHPEKGVVFSPYAFMDGSDLTFSAETIPSLATDATLYNWGFEDGTGEPINLTFIDYWSQFIYPADFFQPDVIGYNERVSSGNMIDNSRNIFPGSVIVEYHFEGLNPQFGGFDWRSLRLVLENYNGQWKVVAIIGDQWTT